MSQYFRSVWLHNELTKKVTYKAKDDNHRHKVEKNAKKWFIQFEYIFLWKVGKLHGHTSKDNIKKKPGMYATPKVKFYQSDKRVWKKIASYVGTHTWKNTHTQLYTPDIDALRGERAYANTHDANTEKKIGTCYDMHAKNKTKKIGGNAF